MSNDQRCDGKPGKPGEPRCLVHPYSDNNAHNAQKGAYGNKPCVGCTGCDDCVEPEPPSEAAKLFEALSDIIRSSSVGWMRADEALPLINAALLEAKRVERHEAEAVLSVVYKARGKAEAEVARLRYAMEAECHFIQNQMGEPDLNDPNAYDVLRRLKIALARKV